MDAPQDFATAQTGPQWSPEDDKKLFDLCKSRLAPGRNHLPNVCQKDWEEIAREFPGRSVKSCKRRFGVLKALDGATIPYRARGTVVNTVKGYWSARDITYAAALFQRLVTEVHGAEAPLQAKTAAFTEIGRRLKRNHLAVWQRYRDHGASFDAGGTAKRNVSAFALTERARREEAGYSRDLTASFFGDPPPGYSALDRKRQGQSA